MTDLTVFTFLHAQPEKWRALRYSPYEALHVNALYRACKEHLKIPHRFVCITDKPEGIECDTIRCWQPTFINGQDSCYRRLRMFDPWFQNHVGTPFMACLDLDVVVLKDMTQPFEFAMQHDFAIMRGSISLDGTSQQVNLYNGGFWVSKIGARNFWSWMRLTRIEHMQRTYRLPSGRKPIGSDQVIISIASGDREVTIGSEHGVVQYRHWRGKTKNASMVFFAGATKPWSTSVRYSQPALFEAWKRFATP